MTISPEQIAAGHAIYTKRTLQVYNFVVLGISNYFIWKCPTKHIVAHYNRNVSANHLDVGVGTGYFLKHCIPGSMESKAVAFEHLKAQRGILE